MILEITPAIDYNVRTLCTAPYPGHKYGCPNFNKKEGCPPKAPRFEEVFNMDGPFYAIINQYNLKKHVLEMKLKHPGWSPQQLKNLLYWQPTARKQLLIEIREFLRKHRGFHVTACPEALGLNVTLTLKQVGFNLEWPPENIACQVAIAGYRGSGYVKKSWHQKEHWSEEKYNIKKTQEAESFHRSRRMFVIYENQLLLADHNVPFSHAEWFEKEGWLKQDDDFFIENYVRGFMDSEGIYAYTGYDFHNSPQVKKTLTHYSILQQFVVKLDAKRETPIFVGMQAQDGGGKFKPQKYLGNVVDFLGEYQFKARIGDGV